MKRSEINLKILSENSPFKFLPRELNARDLLILDSFRITFEILEYNYSLLQSNLLDISLNGKNNIENTSPILNHAWNIIDYTSRFIKLYKTLPSKNNYQNLNNILSINSFRNTIQHLDERINESLLKNKTPFYGIITWDYKNLENNKVTPTVLISGLDCGPKIDIKFNDLVNSNKEINNIIIQTVDKNKTIRINLSDIILKLKKICLKNEIDLQEFFQKNNFKPCNWKKRKDMVIQIKNEK